jgi:hypothetical protein
MILQGAESSIMDVHSTVRPNAKEPLGKGIGFVRESEGWLPSRKLQGGFGLRGLGVFPLRNKFNSVQSSDPEPLLPLHRMCSGQVLEFNN